MFVAFSAFAGIFYWYYQDTQKALRVYAENQGKLENAIDLQQQANESLKKDIVKIQNTMVELNDAFVKSRQQVENITGLLEKGTDGRDLTPGERAVENPESSIVIEDAVNTATTELFRCFEILSGSEIGDSDANTKYINCVNNADNDSM